ncbi:alpha/beta fold hydrolase [Candidatus Woesearchaeota archaeon]|nr:alpha/beta fold hydrolase [Candidatus Woesearchaeota archaeon]
MHYPIVYVFSDKIHLYGLLMEPAKRRKDKPVMITVHGTGSNFYEEDFFPNLADKLNRQGIALLAANNRGNGLLQGGNDWHGATEERFEDCLKDIDAWIEFAQDKGYKSIILQGHSLGTEKVIYYMNKGRYRSKVTGVVLLAFSDSYGVHIKNIGVARHRRFLAEAKKLVSQCKGHIFLSDWQVHGGYFPKAARSYLSFFGDGSTLSEVFPLRSKGPLSYYCGIRVPILAVIGDQQEFTVIPTKRALALLKSENPLTETHQLKNCNHDFQGKEEEIAALIAGFTARQESSYPSTS